MAIEFSKLGWKGNMGNQLFQVASTISIAKKNQHKANFPEWNQEQYFENKLPKSDVNNPTLIKEPNFHYEEVNLGEGNYDLNGWYQSEKYFDNDLVKKQLTLKKELVDGIKEKYRETFSKKTILISIRRGDFVDNPVYFQVPIRYYILSLIEHFPDWKERNIVVTSDDIDYCKLHFDCIDNVYFADGLTAIEQLCLGSMCDDFIISNSTFSWWQAWLGEKKGSKIVRPLKNFDKEFEKKNNDKDYFPERWFVFDHTGKKINLYDTTFVIPLHYDHLDRKKNTDLSICLLQRDFNTNVYVGEQGSNVFVYVKNFAKYRKFSMGVFHRTKMLNDMIKEASTKYVVNWDCDTVLPPLRILMSVEALRKGDDIVYPFDGRVYHVPRVPNFKNLEKSLDIGIYGMNTFMGKGGKDIVSSVGHAVFYNKESFISSGMENEKMISYAPEDCERWDRFHILGLTVTRLKGAMFHMMHFRGKDSSSRNPFFDKNHREYAKVKNMSKEKLIDYVKTWEWIK